MTSEDFILIAGGVGILALSGFLSHLIYNFSKVVKESNKTVADVNKKLEKIDPVIDETTKTLVDLNESVQGINNGIIKPLSSLSETFRGIRQALSVFKDSKQKKDK
ncbi:DUF948 domain-containing protein [Patescibacteria group bacterium]|nr:DUF948 domain-containing protein [Patescibacteria group bacterium]